jgi:type IV secretion system protein VirB5
VTVSINPPADDATILVNPIGLYVEAFDWTQRQ